MAEVGGYDCQFTEKPPDVLVCPVCLLPCREPHLISCCGKKVCHSCISRIQQNDKPCPHCRTHAFITLLDREVERQVLSLKVYCNNKEDGCTWIGELRQLEPHLNSCNALCKFKCGLCCPQQQMLIHERDECELRPEIVLTKTIDELTKKLLEMEKEKETLVTRNEHLQDELGQYKRRVAAAQAALEGDYDKKEESRKVRSVLRRRRSELLKSPSKINELPSESQC